MNLNLDERTKIFDKVDRLVQTKHFDPALNGADWNSLAQGRKKQILACAEPEIFEKEMHRLVTELKTSHTGFRHAGMRNIPARHAINATLHRIAVNGTDRWMFQDVHRGGPAYGAGIRPGDLLLACSGREIHPPNDLMFSVGESTDLVIEKLNGREERVHVRLPLPKSQKHPVTAPEAVHAERLSEGIGLLKVAMFPGAIGIDVAKDIDRGIPASPFAASTPMRTCPKTGAKKNISATPANRPTRAAFTRPGIAASFSPCASFPASLRRKKPTSATNIWRSSTAAVDSPWPSILQRSRRKTLMTAWTAGTTLLSMTVGLQRQLDALWAGWAAARALGGTDGSTVEAEQASAR